MTNPYIKLATDPAVTNQLTLNHALASVCGTLPKEIISFGAEKVLKNIEDENRSKLKKYMKGEDLT